MLAQFSSSQFYNPRTNLQLEDQCRSPYEKANNIKIRSSNRVLQPNGVRCSNTSTLLFYISGAEFTQIDQVSVYSALDSLELQFPYFARQKTHWSFNH